MSQTHLLFAPWNDGTEVSRTVRARVRAWIESGDNVVVLGPKKLIWVEDDSNFPEERFHYHELGEAVQTSEGDLIEPPAGVDAADQGVFQLIFYARAYSVDRVHVFGGITSVLEVLARVKLVEDFVVPFTASILDDIFDVTSSTPEALEVVQNILGRADTVESDRTIEGFTVTIRPGEVPHRPKVSMRRARAALVEKMGMRLPDESHVYLCNNPRREIVLNVIRAFEKARAESESFARNDNALLWIQQDTTDMEVAQTIAASPAGNWMIYTRVPLPPDVLECLYDACDFGVHFGPATAYHGQTRFQIGSEHGWYAVDDMIRVLEVIAEVPMGKLTASVRVPNVVDLSRAMLMAYADH